ncbi:VOC family protein [Embleya sp. NPDC050493]|uniref:VOC family protein n=1 Tax=Embleya sp. NPDC050493 TaxID=3363989 RepID=UPI003799FB1F
MDALHPRLLVDRFADCFRFYDAVLPELIGATRTRGAAHGPYASWDVGAEGVLMLFDRTAMAEVVGTGHLPGETPAPVQDHTMLVSRVADLDTAYALCLAHGAQPVTPPTHRPAWGEGLHTAHVRDPAGTLLALQSY